jgi:hypothetical protein
MEYILTHRKNKVQVQVPRYLTQDLLFSRAIGSLFDPTAGMESRLEIRSHLLHGSAALLQRRPKLRSMRKSWACKAPSKS